MVAARAFAKCHGRGGGLEGKGPGGLLPALQHAALSALVNAASSFDPTRIGQDSGKPVTFAPLARSHAKWACHRLLTSGKGKVHWHDSIESSENIPEIAAEVPDPGEQIDAGRLRARLATLSRRLRKAASLWAEGNDDRQVARALGIDQERLEGVRAELAAALDDMKETELHHPKETREKAYALFAAGKSAREAAADLADVPLGTMSAWRATWSRTPASLPTVTASPPPEAPKTPRLPSHKGRAEVANVPPQAPVKPQPPEPPAAPAEAPPPAAPEPLVLTHPEPAVRPRRPRGVPVSLTLDVEGIGRIHVPARIVRVVYSGALP